MHRSVCVFISACCWRRCFFCVSSLCLFVVCQSCLYVSFMICVFFLFVPLSLSLAFAPFVLLPYLVWCFCRIGLNFESKWVSVSVFSLCTVLSLYSFIYWLLYTFSVFMLLVAIVLWSCFLWLICSVYVSYVLYICMSLIFALFLLFVIHSIPVSVYIWIPQWSPLFIGTHYLDLLNRTRIVVPSHPWPSLEVL